MTLTFLFSININKQNIMKSQHIGPIVLLLIVSIFGSCSSLNKTQKGAAIGTAAGGATGAIVGKATGNSALGAIIGATVGGVSGALIGRKMDKQAEEIEKKVPDAKVLRVGEGIVVEFSSNVLFAFDKSSLNTDSKVSLDKLAEVLKNYPDTDIELQGHTDSKGSNNYNKKLSTERASIVSNYLSQNGISNGRMTVVGYGESLPKYINETEDGRALNRRVEFLISANDKMKSEAGKEGSTN
jgi:outer membrane protein OmpA-like peptidoglycan-associated protein